jgi:uncharacterized SAM-binding protein YcdF (DUF218 family)
MRRRRKKRWVRTAAMIAAGSVIGVVPWSAGLVRFASAIPDTVADPASHTDAIVVLTGGSERVATGLQLLAENKAERMFVSGVHPAVDVPKLIRLAGRPMTDLDHRVEAGHGALDTGGNAAETASWMRERGYRSLRLVTGSYHMPRSLFEFRIALPEAEVIPHPVFPYRVQQRTWWLRPGTAALIIGEYNKYLLASVEHWAGYLLLAEHSPRGIG